MSRNATIGIVAVVLVLLVGWFYIKSQKAATSMQTPPSSQTTQPSESPATESAMPAEKNMVKITADGFSPKTITVKVGESVTWTNADTENHTVNSAPHPTHTAYPPLNLDVIKSGTSKSLTFPTAGTYKYHDHLNPSLTGSVTVQ